MLTPSKNDVQDKISSKMAEIPNFFTLIFAQFNSPNQDCRTRKISVLLGFY
ncbi:hypothetical protein M595_2854 [Lyngbya aestuarii BL J]|uniref:Uncharacterized protein n=1 Tax=Lyngbya aestuarii BL J TaxID=1348334 RepID=U7QJ73_9CYAN|nr:hypothetical protein M595_2854 [Lyngbya aestuarii BL J]